MLEEMEDNGIEVDTYGSTSVTFTGQKNVEHDYFELKIGYSSDKPYDAEVSFEKYASYDDKLRFKIENNRMVEHYNEEQSDFDKLRTVLDGIGYSDKELIKFTGWYLENY